MALLPARSPAAASVALRREDPTLGAVLDFASPAAAIVAAPVPRAARATIWAIASMFAAGVTAMGLIPVDRVVVARGKVVSTAPTIVVQPFETSLVRSIDVHEGETVRRGDLLARLDPTIAEADASSLASQVLALQAEVGRLRAEAMGRPFDAVGPDPSQSLQAAIYAQRRSEREFKLETYRQRIEGLQSTLARTVSDARSYEAREAVAEKVEAMRKELERLQVGSRLNALIANDNRLEITRDRANAVESAESARRELAAMKAERDAYDQSWKADVLQKLSEQTQKLADAREQLRKAELRRQLVELRADRGATVLTIAKVSVGSVLQPAEQFMTLVPDDEPLEIEANIAGNDDGFVHVGASVALKFDTFPFSRYGTARGTVRTVSADSFTVEDEARSRHGSVAAGPGTAQRFYRSRIRIDDVKLHDLPPGSHLLPGMPVTADIKTGKRTVLSYFLGRVLPLAAEGMREP